MDSAPSASRLTEQQQRAVTTREASIVLASGAGCGKTHVLTERYLSHLREDGAEVNQIVAITFTERAARQMRDRIRKAIHHHLHGGAEDEVEKWTRHHPALETAPISTIHAFCGTLLRQSAVEASLDPQFEVLEDVLSMCMESEALTTCLQGLLTSEGDTADALRQVILLYGWRSVLDATQYLMRHWDQLAWQQFIARSDEDILCEWTELAKKTLIPRYLEYILASRSKLSRLLPLIKKHPPLPGPMAENVAILLDEVPMLPCSENFTESVERLAEAAKVGRQGANAAVYEEIKKAFADFRTDLRGLKLERFDYDPETMPLALETGRRFLRIASEAMTVYQERKSHHGLVDFQDLLILSRNLLRDHDDVRARLQDRYRFLLIDELQDTDPVQMELVEYLCGGEMTTGKLFAVGDHSQSIYRFRGADVHLFQNLRGHVPQEGRQGLTVNFRSQPSILDFTNQLLGERLTDYQPLKAFHPQINESACIEFLWSAANDEDNAAEARRQEAEGIASRISQMIQSEKLVVEDGQLRPVKAGDVVLLFRAMSNVHLYENALRRYGLDYYLVGGRAFFAQQEIYDVLNLLRTLENPQDELSLAGTLRSPLCCLSDESLFLLRYHPTEESRLKRRDLWTGLHDDNVLSRASESQRETIRRARAHLDAWRSQKDRLSIAGLLNCILSDSAYDASTQVEFLGDRKLANLWKLLDLARTFDRSGLFGLADFIQRLNDLVGAQPREEQAATQPENADVVRLMSIHQSKGLEFPVVIIPDIDSGSRDHAHPVAHWDAKLGCVVRPPADEDPPPFADYGWGLWKIQEEIEDWSESLRTLYVGCTRAMDYLILSSAIRPSFKPTSIWMKLLAERFDLFESSESVKVSDRQPPLEPPPFEPTPLASTLQTSNLFVTPDESKSIDASMNQRMMSIAELEKLIIGESTEDFNQFDAEDGSDLMSWRSRRERVEGESDSSDEERAFRRAIQQWNWQSREASHPWMEGLIETFFDEIDASTSHHNVEVILPWPEKGTPIIHGVVDSYWENEIGWQLLRIQTAPRGPAKKSTKTWELCPGRILEAFAIREQLGSWPSSISVYHVERRELTRQTMKRFPFRKLLSHLEGEMRRHRDAEIESLPFS